MDLEQDYIEYVIEFSLSMFAISATYFFNPGSLISWGTLMLIPLLYGYTTFISREHFNYASLMALIALVFIPLGATMAVLALTISLGNVFVSFFAHGESFKDYYSATLLPLLFTGLIVGGAVYMGANQFPSFNDRVVSTTSNFASEQASQVLEQTDIVSMQENANKQMVRQVGTGTVMLTQQYVINETKKDLTREDLSAVNNAFTMARANVPDILVNRTEEQQQQQAKAVNIPRRVEGSVKNVLEGPAMILLIPFIALGFYTLQPLVGLLTAISAKSFDSLAGKEK
ncbi:MAG: hypothetical protein ABEJ99_03750 [Candidatus Nanohaloarchaea archaeon]